MQALGHRMIEVEPLGLADDHVRRDAEPIEIGLDGVGVFARRALQIGVVEAQDERPPSRRA